LLQAKKVKCVILLLTKQEKFKKCFGKNVFHAAIHLQVVKIIGKRKC